MDGTKFIHPEMVRFVYQLPLKRDRDELQAGRYTVKFDEANINEELGFCFTDYP